jgi:ubiquinol-cytochrome c reductase iron-sulfur subunit
MEKTVSHAEDHEGTRRDFLYYATGGAAVVVAGRRGVAARQPDEPLRRRPGAELDPGRRLRRRTGTQISVKFLGKPVFIRRRTPRRSRPPAPSTVSDLIDRGSENPNFPPGTDASTRTARWTRRANGSS